MTDIRLFLGEDYQEVFFEETPDLSITKQWDDINDIASIIIDNSKSLSIPSSVNNDKVFGNCYRTDRVITYTEEDSINMGAAFDPTKRVPFKLLQNGGVMLEGYFKLDKVKTSNGHKYYDIVLYSALGGVLRQLKDGFTLDYCASREADFNLNAATVAARMKNTNKAVSFTPTIQGNPEGFDPKSIQSGTTIYSIEDFPNNGTTIGAQITAAGYSTDSIIGEGMLPEQFNDYRSYNQQPFLCLTTLFYYLYLYARKIGYTLSYPSTELTNLVMLLKRFNADTESKGSNVLMPSDVEWTINQGLLSNRTADTLSPRGMLFQLKSKTKENGYLTNSTNTKYINQALRIQLKCDINSMGQYGRKAEIADDLGLKITPYIVRVDGSTIVPTAIGKSTVLLNSDTDIPTTVTSSMNVIYPSAETTVLYSRAQATLNVDVPIQGSYVEDGYLWVEFCWIGTDGNQADLSKDPIYYHGSNRRADIRVNIDTNTQALSIEEFSKRSDATVSLKDFWNTEKTPWELVLNYTKMFGWVWVVDEVAKTISIKTRKDYFSDYTIVDWDNKVDLSKDYELAPLRADYARLLFDYEDLGAKYTEEYKKKTNSTYGSLTLNTENAFTSEEESLLEYKIPESMTAQIWYTPWVDIKAQRYNYFTQSKCLPMLRDDDGKTVDSFGSLYYIHRGATGNYRITDDTTQMGDIRKFCFNLNGGSTVTSYNHLSLTRGEYISTYGIPSVNYGSEGMSGKKGLYERWWRDYCYERYGAQAVVWTVQVRLTADDIKDFKHKNFVLIDGVLWFVNKIDGWSPNSVTTKCELYRVNNIENYTS